MIERIRGLFRKKFVRDTLILQVSKITMAVLSLTSFVVTVRLMGFENYGVWKLTLAFFGLWLTLDLTGVGMSTATHLAMAVGKRDENAALDWMAFFVKMNMAWALLTIVVMFAFGPTMAAALYDGDPHIGELVRWFSFTLLADPLYTLVLLSLQTRRMMRHLAITQNVNQIILFSLIVGAMVIQPSPEAMVIARLIYSYASMLMVFVVYARLREQGEMPFPPLRAIFRRAVSVPVRPYWRSGFLMALDKNVGNLYPQAVMTLVGMVSGETAVGYLGTGYDLISRSNTFMSAALDNMQAVVPQAVGRGDFVGLRRNFGRVLLGLFAMSAFVYVSVAVFAPLAVPLLFGADAAAAVPVVIVLTLYGAVTTMGGIFGPLYRAFDQVGAALAVKLVTAAIMLPTGIALINQFGALGGAWTINGLFALSVVLTAAVTLPALQKRAAAAANAA